MSADAIDVLAALVVPKQRTLPTYDGKLALGIDPGGMLLLDGESI
jgi:hypothetical protein